MDDSQAVDATHVPVPAGPRDPEARLALIESQMVELRRENESLRAVLAQLEAKAESMGTPIASKGDGETFQLNDAGIAR